MSAIIETLKQIRGQGPLPWSYVRASFIANGGEKYQMAKAISLMQTKYPHRLLITRPHNVSDSATIEVPA
jgi:hypothetical protein